MDLNKHMDEMSFAEMRDKLIGDRAIYEKSKETFDRTMTNIEKSLKSLSQADIVKLRELGLDIDGALNIDFEEAKKNKAYLLQCRRNLQDFIINLRNSLRRGFSQ